MKLLPFILAFILLVPGLRPCMGSFVCEDARPAEPHACRAAEDAHACCQFPGEEERAPAEEDPCSEGCYCFCCVLVVVATPVVLPSSSPQETDGQKTWKASAYFHEFTHLIWHPPQAG